MKGVDNKTMNQIKVDAFRADGNLQMLGAKSNEKAFVCDICEKPFGSSAHLYAEHMKSVHGIDVIKMDESGTEFESMDDMEV